MVVACISIEGAENTEDCPQTGSGRCAMGFLSEVCR
jgi:hypothetical protein